MGRLLTDRPLIDRPRDGLGGVDGQRRADSLRGRAEIRFGSGRRGSPSAGTHLAARLRAGPGVAGRPGRLGGRCRGRAVPLPDPVVHRAVHRAGRLQRRGSCAQPEPSVAGHLLRAPGAGHRRPDLRAARRPLRAGGPRSRGAGGDVRGRRAWRADRPHGTRGQVPGIGVVHRLRRLGRARGADRADRLGAGVDPRPGAARAGVRGSDCWWRAVRREASRRRSTPRSRACSSLWS